MISRTALDRFPTFLCQPSRVGRLVLDRAWEGLKKAQLQVPLATENLEDIGGSVTWGMLSHSVLGTVII